MADHINLTAQQYLIREFRRMDEDYVVRYEQWNKMYRQFRGKFEQDHVKNLRSRVFINATKQAVTAAVAAVMEALFPTSEFFDTAGREASDVKRANIVKQIVQYYTDKANYAQEFETHVLQAAIYGTSVASIPLTTEVVRYIKHTATFGLSRLFGTQQELVEDLVRSPGFTTRDLYDFWIDPHAYEVDHASGMFLRSWTSKAKMVVNPVYFNVKEISGGANSLAKDDQDRREMLHLPAISRADDVEIHEYWGEMPKSVLLTTLKDEMTGSEYDEFAGRITREELEKANGEMVEVVAALSNRNTLVRLDVNPHMAKFRPVIKSVWEKVPFEFYGRGIVENARGGQIALNATINMALDEKAVGIRKVIAINVAESYEDFDYVTEPGEVWPFKSDPNKALKILDSQDLTARSHDEARFFERIIQEATGVTKYTQGTDSPSLNRTATGLSLIMGSATRQLKHIISGFERSAIAPSLRMFYQIIMQYVPPGIRLRVVGGDSQPQDVQFNPVEISGDYDFIPLGTLSISAQEIQVQQLISFLDATANEFDSPKIDRTYLLKKIYQAFGFRDAEKAFVQPQQLPPQAQGLGEQPAQPGQPQQPTQPAQPGQPEPGTPRG